jgi:thiol-disulfide isomerase/thioredoxin
MVKYLIRGSCMSKAEIPKKIKTKISNTVRDEIKRKDEVFVLFYATWCPFSQRFLPVFKEYSTLNPEKCLSVIVDEEPELCEECGIEYYPTVILFEKGKMQKRLDSEPHIGLNKEKLEEFTKKTTKL